MGRGRENKEGDGKVCLDVIDEDVTPLAALRSARSGMPERNLNFYQFDKSEGAEKVKVIQ